MSLNAKNSQKGVKFEQGQFLEIIHNIQETYGYIPEREIDKIAREFNVPRSRYMEQSSFIPCFILNQRENILSGFVTLSCHLNGSHSIVQTIKSYLGIENGETTEDKMFTPEVVECLGYCGEGPVRWSMTRSILM